MKRIMVALMAAMFAVLGLSLVSAPAASAPALEVSAGQFCGNSDHWKIKIADNGDTVQCLKAEGVVWRWKKIVGTSPSSSVSATSSSSPSSMPSSSSSSSVSATPSPSLGGVGATRTPVASAGLPVTGAPIPIVVGAGIVLVALGVGAVVFARRKRNRFVA